MKNANDVLETERREGRLGERDIENLGELDGEGGRGAGYIEMNLGLGVLEEVKKEKAEVKKEEEEGIDSFGDEEDEDESASESEEGEDDCGGDWVGVGDVLGDMMGRKRGRGNGKKKVGIEEVRS